MAMLNNQMVFQWYSNIVPLFTIINPLLIHMGIIGIILSLTMGIPWVSHGFHPSRPRPSRRSVRPRSTCAPWASCRRTRLLSWRTRAKGIARWCAWRLRWAMRTIHININIVDIYIYILIYIYISGTNEITYINILVIYIYRNDNSIYMEQSIYSQWNRNDLTTVSWWYDGYIMGNSINSSIISKTCIFLFNATISGWWVGTWILFSPIVGMMIQSDFHIFQRSWNHQPVYIDNQ